MGQDFPYPLIEDPEELARLGEWSAQVYRDFESLRAGALTEAEVAAKYRVRVAILCLDMTGFTEAAIQLGELRSLLRIRDVQTVCLPIMQSHHARLVRAFADDLTALFDDPGDALDAALEVHRRISEFNRSELASAHPAECCIGLGYGDVFAIGPNLAMGDEMNRASKLGEDTARAGETLVTGKVRDALAALRPDCIFSAVKTDDLPFPYYSVLAQP